MKSSPRNFRLSEDALKALKILEGASPNSSRGEVISRAIINAAKGIVATPPVKFQLLDPSQYLHFQASISELEGFHRESRTALLRIRPKDKDWGKKISDAIAKIDAETEHLAKLRRGLAQLARTTEALSAEDHQRLAILIKWMAKRVVKAEEPQRPIYELELRLIQSLIP